MAQEKKGPFQRWGESLKKKRSWILYGTAVATLFLTAACWTLLPAQVGLTGLFALLFAWRPKEVVYFVALCLAVLLQLSLLLVNLMV